MPNKFKSGDYSRVATQNTFNRLKKRFAVGDWLSSMNRYRLDCTNRIDQDCAPPRPHRIKHSQLAEYIAASAPLHCLDGWSFLGKSIICHVMGDTASCKHFAYYAELRAVMALLASEGIGVFKNKHFAIHSANGVTSILEGPINGSTHTIVKEQFQEWAGSTKSADLFDKLICPRGKPLENWFSAISTTPLRWIAQDWLLQWGYDLTTIEEDHTARNQASYRPTGLTDDLSYLNSHQLRQSMELVENIWRMCATDGTGGLTIDLYLLRRSWETYAKQNKIGLTHEKVQRDLQNFGILEPELTTLTDLITRRSQPNDPLVLEKASTRGKITDRDYHMQMMSRATLLLRLATGVGTGMIKKASLSRQELEFWWKGLGENFGLWKHGDPDPILDLWVEIDAALQNLSSAASGVADHFDWRTTLSREVLALSGCERIALSQFCL